MPASKNLFNYNCTSHLTPYTCVKFAAICLNPLGNIKGLAKAVIGAVTTVAMGIWRFGGGLDGAAGQASRANQMLFRNYIAQTLLVSGLFGLLGLFRLLVLFNEEC